MSLTAISEGALHSVSGDFALSAIAIRLLAPDPESLLEYMPDARPGQSIYEWEEFSRGIEWRDEAQSLLYVGNFVHEFVHLLQHTTLFQCMHQVHTFHSLVYSTMSVIMNLRESKRPGTWPPKVPLLEWIEDVDKEKGEALWRQWILADAYFRLYEGDEEFAEHYCYTIGKAIEEVLIKPFNPRVSHLDREPSAPFHEFNDLQITTRMLLESQATALQYRFLGSFYGEGLAQQLIGGSPRACVRRDYDVLHLVAICDGIALLLPLLVDWAFMGQRSFPKEPPYQTTDYSAIHPGWRFVRLYNAAKQAVSEGRIPKGHAMWESLKDIQTLQETVYAIAALPLDDIQYVIDWVEGLPDTPLKAIFATNILGRKEHPEAYASLEANLTTIQSWTCMPIVMFRDKPLVRYHPGKRLDVLEQVSLDHFAKRIFEINRMIQGVKPSCPFCVGVDNGQNGKIVPPVGSQTWGVKGQDVSPTCHCGWGLDFKVTWGVAPEEIHFMPKGDQV